MEDTLHLGVIKLVVHIKRGHNTSRMAMVAMNGTVTLITFGQRREILPTSRRSSDQKIQKGHPCILVVRKEKESTERDPVTTYLIAWDRKERRRIYGMCSLISARLGVEKVQ